MTALREPTREHYVPGQRPDWSLGISPPITRIDARRPMAVRRMVPVAQLPRLRFRWFALGCLASLALVLLVRLSVVLA